MADPIEIRLASDGKHLMTADGRLLYYFVPMRQDPTHQNIDWGDEWPSYLSQWVVDHWKPLTGEPKALPPLKKEDFKTFARPPKAHVGQQITYRGWWLYVPVKSELGSQAVPGLWELVSADISPLGDDDVGDPKVPTGGP